MKDSKIIYCTYFDKDYLLKGLALYFSLIKHNPKVKLWILAMDDYSKNMLQKIRLKNARIIDKKDFEDNELLKAKKNRNKIEYLWTCTPSLPLYIFRKSKITQKVVYLDADLYFFSSTDPAFKELGNDSIYTVEHRFPKGQESRSLTSGRFNVGFQVFTRTSESMNCLNRWRKQCLEWCYWKEETERFGDQLYLNEWPKLYKNLVISKNLGIDLAPWNESQYEVTKKKTEIYVNSYKLVCYHFHQFEILGKNKFRYVSGYNLPKNIIDLIYKPYEDEIRKNIQLLFKLDPSFTIEVANVKLEQRVKGEVAKLIGHFYWKLRNILLRTNQKQFIK